MHDDLGAAWAEAEDLAADKFVAAGTTVPAGVRVLGPFPMIGRPFTYQANVWDVNGLKHGVLTGLGETPAEALRELADNIREGRTND
jgi:hypothetical protein